MCVLIKRDKKGLCRDRGGVCKDSDRGSVCREAEKGQNGLGCGLGYLALRLGFVSNVN